MRAFFPLAAVAMISCGPMGLKDLDASAIAEANQEQHWLNGGEAQTRIAPDCSEKTYDWVRARILRDAPARHHRATLDCNLTLGPKDVVERVLILEGTDASGVRIDCNGAKLNGGSGAPNAGKDMIQIRSVLHSGTWQRPTDVTIRGCEIVGSVRIWGRGENGEADSVRFSSLKTNHTARLRASAPTRILLENLKIRANGGRTPLYLAPGVTYVTLINSELRGRGTRTAIYLDAESGYNTIKNNYIHVAIFDEWSLGPLPTGVNRLGPQISIDASSDNRIIGNRFAELGGGGIYAYRNCGEGGTIRHNNPTRNEIINNTFYYDKYDGENPSVFLGSRGQWWRTFGSGHCDDNARNNVVMQNQIYKLPVDRMIKEGESSDRPNYINHNETVNERKMRRAGCFVIADKKFILDGESERVVTNFRGRRLTATRSCTDGTLSTSTT